MKSYKRGVLRGEFDRISLQSEESVTLGSLCLSLSSGHTVHSEENGCYPLFGSTGVIGKTNIAEYNAEIVLVARVGANAGQVNYHSGACGVTDNTLVIQVDPQKVSAKFIMYFLIYFDIHRLIFGSGQPLVTGGQLKSIKIPYPPLAEQQSLAARFYKFESKIDTGEKILEELRRLKKGLVQKLFI